MKMEIRREELIRDKVLDVHTYRLLITPPPTPVEEPGEGCLLCVCGGGWGGGAGGGGMCGVCMCICVCVCVWLCVCVCVRVQILSVRYVT